MSLSPQDALVQLMVLAASADTRMTDREFLRIDALISSLPVFVGYDRAKVTAVANACVDTLNSGQDIESVIGAAVAALPARLQDTAYALAVEVATADLKLRQSELRLLEMVRDHLNLDRLVTAAIETAVRARFRHP